MMCSELKNQSPTNERKYIRLLRRRADISVSALTVWRSQHVSNLFLRTGGEEKRAEKWPVAKNVNLPPRAGGRGAVINLRSSEATSIKSYQKYLHAHEKL